VIMAEVLNKSMQRAAYLGLIKGLQIGYDAIQLTHLQFADDTLVFCEADMECVKTIKGIFITFQAFSGLCVNYSKSGLLVIGKDEAWAKQVEKLLGCVQIKLPIKYLGIPLGANMRKASSWQSVLDKVQKRLLSWKSCSLSRAGKVVMIKAVLNSLPMYYLSMFKIPKKVANDIVRIQRKFLWSGEKGGRFIPLVKWDIVQKQKSEGGLGVGDLEKKNAALLFKWWWRFINEEDMLWKKVIQSIHREGHGLIPTCSANRSTGPWQTIKRLITDKQPLSLKIMQNLQVEVGNGERTKFWEDKWLQEGALMSLYPQLYSISSQQKTVVANMGWYEGSMWKWVFVWTKELTQEEGREVERMLSKIEKHNPVQNKEDVLLWKAKKCYTVKEFQKETTRGAVYDSIVCKVWMKLAPPKVEFFMWLALLGKLNTKEVLWKKGLLQVNQLNCPFCTAEIESLSHILMACPASWTIWDIIAKDMDQVLSMPGSFKQHFEEWMKRKWRNTIMKKIWCSSFFAISWSLWLMRNEMIFQQKEMNVQMLCNLIRWRVAFWTKAWKDQIPYSTSELVRKFDVIPLLFP